jgi:hypothetical protein
MLLCCIRADELVFGGKQLRAVGQEAGAKEAIAYCRHSGGGYGYPSLITVGEGLAGRLWQGSLRLCGWCRYSGLRRIGWGVRLVSVGDCWGCADGGCKKLVQLVSGEDTVAGGDLLDGAWRY